MKIDRGDIPPAAEAAIRQFRSSLADLSTFTHELRNKPLPRPAEFVVDEQYLTQLAALPGASRLLRTYADGVDRGDYSWRQVVEGRWQKPPEILQLLEQGVPFRLADPAVPSPAVADDPAPQWRPVPAATPAPGRRDPGVVGPSDWPDDLDDYPDGTKSWLT